MDSQEELALLEKEFVDLAGSSIFKYGKPIDDVTSGRLRGLLFRIRELDVERLLNEGYKSIPQDDGARFSDAEILAAVRRLPAHAEWHVCRCGKCKNAFAGGAEDAFEAERVLGAMFRYVKAQQQPINS